MKTDQYEVTSVTPSKHDSKQPTNRPFFHKSMYVMVPKVSSSPLLLGTNRLVGTMITLTGSPHQRSTTGFDGTDAFSSSAVEIFSVSQLTAFLWHTTMTVTSQIQMSKYTHTTKN